MNKTFKVVFNKARSALMVVNEATSSVQKKGSKAAVLVAASFLLAAAGSADAATSTKPYHWNGSKAPAASTTFKLNEEQLTLSQNDTYAAIAIGGWNAKGSAKNISIQIDATGNTDTRQLAGVIDYYERKALKVAFTGDYFSVNVNTDFAGTGNNSVSGIIENSTLNSALYLSATDTNIAVTSTAVNGKSVYGLAAFKTAGYENTTGQIYLEGKTVDVTAKSNTVRTSANDYSEVVGIYAGTSSTVSSAAGTALNVEAYSYGVAQSTASSYNALNKTGSSPVAGIKVTGGTIDFLGAATITASGVGADAEGISVIDESINTTNGHTTGSSLAQFGSNVELKAISETGTATAASVIKSSTADVTSKLLFNGGSTLEAVSTSGTANGLIVSGGTVAMSGTSSIRAVGRSSFGVRLDRAEMTGGELSVFAGQAGAGGESVGLTLANNSDLTLTGSLDIQAGKAFQVDATSTVNLQNGLSLQADSVLGTFAGRLNISGGSTKLTAANGYFSDAAGVTFTGGDLDITQVALSDGDLKNLTVSGGNLILLTDQLFTQSLGAEGTVQNPGSVKDNSPAVQSGSLTFADSRYNLAYVNAANSLISNAALIFTGDLVSLTDPSAVNKMTVAEAAVLADTAQMFSEVSLVGDSAKTRLVVGSLEGGMTAQESEVLDRSFGFKGVVLTDSHNEVVVNAGRTLTLFGSAEADSSYSFFTGGADNTVIRVGTGATAGTLRLGAPEGDRFGMVDDEVIVSSLGAISLGTGSYSFSKHVSNAGSITAAEGSVLIFSGELNNTGSLQADKLVVADGFSSGTLNASSVSVENAASGFIFKSNVEAAKVSVAEGSVLTSEAGKTLKAGTLLNFGTLNASDLTVQDGADVTGLGNIVAMTVSGSTTTDGFVQKADRRFESLTVDAGGILSVDAGKTVSAGSLDVKGQIQAGEAQIVADALTMTTSSASLAAKEVAVKSGTYKSGSLTVDRLTVDGSGDELFDITKSSAEFSNLSIGSTGKVNAKTLKISNGGYLENHGCLKTTNTLTVSDGVDDGAEFNVSSLTVGRAANKGFYLNSESPRAITSTVTVQKEGRLTAANGFSAKTVKNSGSVTVSDGGLTISNTLTNNSGASIEATEAAVNVLNLANSGSMTVQTLSVATGTNAGDLKADTLIVTGTTTATGFGLSKGESFGSVSVETEGILTSSSDITVSRDLSVAGSLTAETIQTQGFSAKATAIIKANSLTAASGLDEAQGMNVKALNVTASTEGLTLNADRRFDSVTLRENAKLSAKNLIAANIVSDGTFISSGVVKTDALTSNGVFKAYGLIVKNGADKGSAFSVSSLTVNSGRFELGAGRTLTNVAVESGEEGTGEFIAPDGFALSGNLTGNGRLQSGQIRLSEGSSLSEFTGEATLIGGTYVLMSMDKWFGGNVMLAGGTLDVTGMSLGASTLAATVLQTGGTILATSEQFFEKSLNASGDNTEPGAFTGHGLHLDGGTLSIGDASYNASYAGAAGLAVGNDAKLIFIGNLVTPTVAKPTDPNQPGYSEIDPSTGHPEENPGATGSTGIAISQENKIAYEDVNRTEGIGNVIMTEVVMTTKKADDSTTKDDLIIGAALEPGESEATTNVVKSDLGVKAVEVSANSQVVKVNDGKTLTLVGGQEQLVQGSDKDVTLQIGDSKSVGYVQLGVDAEGVNNGGTLNTNVEVRQGSVLAVNAGTFEAPKQIKTTGVVTVAEKGELKVGNLVIEGDYSSVQVSGSLEVDTLGTSDSEAGAGVIYVGNSEIAGSVKIGTSHGGHKFFLDPAFSSAGIDGASKLVYGDATVVDKILVGENSYAVIGATDDSEFVQTFKNSGMTWGAEGVKAALFVGKPITIDDATGGLTVDGTQTTWTEPAANTVSIEANSVVIADVAAINGTDDALITADTVTVDSTAKAVLLNVQQGEEYTLVSSGEGFAAEQIVAGNAMFGIAEGAGSASSNAVFELLGADTVYGKLLQSGALADAAMSTAGTDAYAYADSLLTDVTGNKAQAAARFDAAMNPAGVLGVYTTAKDRSTELVDAIREEAGAAHEPRLWIQMTGGRTKLDGIATGSQSLKLKTESFGVAAGGETSFDDTTIGAAFSAGNGSTRNNALDAKDQFDYYGVGAYAQRDVAGITLTGTLTGTWLKSELGIGGKVDVKNDADTAVYALGIEGKKAFELSGVTLTPFVGLDVFHVRADGFKTAHDVKVESANATVVEVPIGARASADFTTADGTSVRPAFSLAVIPAFGDRDIDVTSRFAGAKSNMNYTFADDVQIRSKLGITAEKKNVRFGFDLGYNWGNEERSALSANVKASFLF